MYRDEMCAVLADLFPANEGHLLVVPSAHVAHVDDLSPDVAGHMMRMASAVVAAIRRSGIRSEGFNVILNDGAVAGQEVFHTHLHIIPRYAGDGHRRAFFPRDPEPWTREELDRVTEEVRRGLEV